MQLRGVSVVSMLAVHAEGIKSMKNVQKICNFKFQINLRGFVFWSIARLLRRSILFLSAGFGIC